MESEMKYSANLTGAAFMFFEFKQVVLLKKQFTDKEIRKKVIDENIFQYEKVSSLKRGIPTIIRRVNVLDESLREMVSGDTLDIGKTINLYSIMKTDRLFYEFMVVVIKPHFDMNDYVLERKELNMYFTEKAEQVPEISSWSELTIGKLKQVYMKILLESGILANLKSGELNRLLINEQVKEHLRHSGDSSYIEAIGG